VSTKPGVSGQKKIGPDPTTVAALTLEVLTLCVSDSFELFSLMLRPN